MVTESDMQYTQLDSSDRLQAVRNRIRELEGAHQQLRLRIEAPAPGDNVSQQDRTNLQTLESSLETLHNMEGNLKQAVESS